MNPSFESIFESAARHARAEAIAAHKIVFLRSDVSGAGLTDEARATAVVESLIRSVAVADMMADNLPVDDLTLNRIHAASMKLASMFERMRARAGVNCPLPDLSGAMGRRAP